MPIAVLVAVIAFDANAALAIWGGSYRVPTDAYTIAGFMGYLQ